MIKNCFWIIICLFVTSNCLICAERGSSAPYISGDTFRAYADHTYDELNKSINIKNVRDGDTIFVKTDYLNDFFKSVHKKIKSKYILITHNSDYHIPGHHAHYLKDEKLLAWFGQNVDAKPHPKLHAIPIGIANKCWEHGNISKIKHGESLIPQLNKNIFLYMNFSVGTFFQERNTVHQLFKNKDYCVVASPKEYSTYLSELVQAKFVLSPRGNGLDCHRTWEALLMGAIPIVKTSTLDPMYEGLPVLIIADWSKVDYDFLLDKYEEMQNKTFEMEKIYFDYWWKKIESFRPNQ